MEHLRRQVAMMRPPIDYRYVFACIDADRDDFLRIHELRDFLASNGFYATEKEL